MNDRNADTAESSSILQAYLLGRVDLDATLSLQRRFHYEVTGNRTKACLILCEHPPTVTIGRSGSLAQVHLESDELESRGWSVRHLGRGGGCMLHLPGQLVGYWVYALPPQRRNVQHFLDHLHQSLAACLSTFDLQPTIHPNQSGIWIQDRRIAHVGVAIRDWVSSFGFAINIDPDLERFRDVACDGDARPMTSLARERRLPVRPGTVRQRLLEQFALRFGFHQTIVFHHHSALLPRMSVHAVSSPA